MTTAATAMLIETTAVTPLRPLAVPNKGSGPVTCCGGHTERCLFGRQHTWSTWFEDAKLQRTRLTIHCYDCGGVCVAEEGPCTVCGTAIARDEVNAYPVCFDCARNLRAESDGEALDRIAALLKGGGCEFAEATLDEIGRLVRATGRN